MSKLEELKLEYARLMHAMQSGVAADQGLGSQDGSPKHLRVGVNSALCSHAALVRLLIEAGVITEERYVTELVEQLRQEVRSYQLRLSEKTGTPITLA